MTKSSMKYVIASLVLVTTACKDKKTDGSGSAKPTSGDVAGGGGGSYPAAFAAWDMPGRHKAWQGAWAGDGGAAGWKAAWQIAGDKVTIVDGKGEKQLEFKLLSPCSASLIEKKADGSTESTISVFTLQDGKVITGLGDAGQKKGDTAVVCGGGSMFTVDAKGCTEWTDDWGKLKSAPGECGFRKEADKDVFFYKAMGHESTLLVDGDVIWSEQLKMTHATSHPDLAAAKAAQGL